MSLLTDNHQVVSEVIKLVLHFIKIQIPCVTCISVHVLFHILISTTPEAKSQNWPKAHYPFIRYICYDTILTQLG